MDNSCASWIGKRNIIPRNRRTFIQQREVAILLDTMASKFDVYGSSFTSVGGSTVLEEDLETIIMTIDSLSTDTDKKKAFSSISGQFISNVLASPTIYSQNKAVYNKITSSSTEQKDNGNIWAQYSFSGNNLVSDDEYFDDHTDSINGITAGYDRFINKNKVCFGLLHNTLCIM